MASMYDNFVAMVQNLISPIDYYAVYTATVISVHALGGTSYLVDLNPDNPRFVGLTFVPLYLGTPGVTAFPIPGTKALFSFLNGNPGEPYVLGFLQPAGSSSEVIPLAVSVSINPTGLPASPNGAARAGDPVAQTADMVAWMSQVAGYINSIVPLTVSPPAPATFAEIESGSITVTIGD